MERKQASPARKPWELSVLAWTAGGIAAVCCLLHSVYQHERRVEIVSTAALGSVTVGTYMRIGWPLPFAEGKKADSEDNLDETLTHDLSQLTSIEFFPLGGAVDLLVLIVFSFSAAYATERLQQHLRPLTQRQVGERRHHLARALDAGCLRDRGTLLDPQHEQGAGGGRGEVGERRDRRGVLPPPERLRDTRGEGERRVRECALRAPRARPRAGPDADQRRQRPPRRGGQLDRLHGGARRGALEHGRCGGNDGHHLWYRQPPPRG